MTSLRHLLWTFYGSLLECWSYQKKSLLGNRIVLTRPKSSLLIKAQCYNSCSLLLNINYALILFLLYSEVRISLKRGLLVALIAVTISCIYLNSLSPVDICFEVDNSIFHPCSAVHALYITIVCLPASCVRIYTGVPHS